METIQKRVLVMLLYPFLRISMAQSYQDTIYKILALDHHLILEFVFGGDYVLLFLSIASAVFSQIAC